MTVTAHSTLSSAVEVEISSTLTPVPGMTNFSFNPGENHVFEKGDLAADYDEIQGTGVQGGGGLSGSMMWDPLDTVHQWLHARFNDQAEIIGNAVMGATGVEYATSMILTKWEIKADRKAGFVVDYEFKFTDRVTLNEADPV
ncbi:MAG: hypothetical protein KDA96_10180 [Planctomycetaceae bacterium]|nr:hypothetical protein [Planctomycetaceae bacterium]